MSSLSSSSAPGLSAIYKNPKPWKRGKIRNATFIIPSTRERVKRQISLRNPANFDEPPGAAATDLDESFRPFEQHLSLIDILKTAFHNTRISLIKAWRGICSDVGRKILKCSLAYLLASMGTFIPIISNWLGNQDGKHMVATIVVYFHPGRSAGSMIEAVIFGVVAFLYATFISICSMAVSVLCESQLGLIELGYIIVLVVFCGGGLGFVGWVKQKLNQPLVNVACSLTSLAIITVLTKENAVQTAVFSNDKIVQVMKMLIIAIIISTVVNLIIWPIYARNALRQSMIDATNAFSDMLSTITQSFLTGSETDLRSSAFEDATRRYKSTFGQLHKHLKEAKAEHYVLGTESEYKCEFKLVNCMGKLAQAIGGLRSAAMTQFALMKVTSPSGASMQANTVRYMPTQTRNESSLSSRLESFAVLTAIDEAPDESSEIEDIGLQRGLGRQGSSNLSQMPAVRTPSEIFERFILYLGPSMKSLAYTLTQILRELPFGNGPDFKIVINEHFRASLTDALQLYRDARAEALTELYKSKALGSEKVESTEADFEEVAASCGHFSFNLQDFAEEMQTYLEVLEELKDEVEKPKRKSWNWLKFWQSQKANAPSTVENSDPERDNLIEHDGEGNLPKDATNPLAPQTYPTTLPTKNNNANPILSKIMEVVGFLERDDIRFAIKIGIGAAFWAMFSFLDTTRPIYSHWRGEWGLMSFMLVSSMTIGASNTTGYSRFIGTLLGATLAIIIWLSCRGHAVPLAISGWAVSVFCFYVIIARGQGPLGRFIVLTYNISALYAYSLSVRQGDNDEDEGGANPIITEICLHRVVAVLCGILWALFVTRLIWPISARQKLKDGLSLIWLRMGLIWKRDPLSAILDGNSSNAYMDLREEISLQRYVSHLETLRTAAVSEFELRGPFAQAEFARIMDSTTKMLDAFHAMNIVIQKDLKASAGEAAILKFTAKERAQLAAQISHLFQVLASSMKLEYPVNDALPSTAAERDKLLAKLFQFRRKNEAKAGPEEEEEEEGGGGGGGGEERLVAKDEDYALLYAYALVTGQLAEEIMRVEKEIRGLFGVLDEGMFRMY